MEFRDKIYKIVKNIPKGRVATYKSIAIAIGQPQTSRAVANALAQNFNPKIPCHRVIRSDGFLGGYNRGGLTHKAKLLRSEGVLVKNNHVEPKFILPSQ
mgnify:CR=1 FL=1